MSERFPRTDDDDDAIAPDVASPDEKPLTPGEALHREESKYGEASADANRDDQWDVHHGQPEDVV